jgi:hypothetical protein
VAGAVVAGPVVADRVLAGGANTASAGIVLARVIRRGKAAVSPLSKGGPGLGPGGTASTSRPRECRR